jgi:two-component system response regulator FixJ
MGSNNRTIYVVDDDEAFRRSVGFALRTSGYAVTQFASGAEILKAARKLEPGCILLDIRMPDIDGLEVQRNLREQGVALPIIIMTGHGDVSVAVQAMKAGAVDFIEKPFERAVLLSAVEKGFERIENAGRAGARAAEAELKLGALTAREKDVLVGLAKGFPNKTIAFDLGISPNGGDSPCKSDDQARRRQFVGGAARGIRGRAWGERRSMISG